MAYVLFTTKVKTAIDSIKKYPLVNLEINVDGMACLLVKYADRKYYEECVTRENMKLGAEELAKLIVARVEAYWTGWAFKKGLR